MERAQEDRDSLEPDLLKVMDFVTTANIMSRAVGIGHGIEGDADHVLPQHLAWVLGGRGVDELKKELVERVDASRAFLAV